MIKKIESKDNKFYKKIKSLNKSSHRKKNNLFMVEGKKMFLEALKSHIQIQFSHWDITRPGYVEADTVAHCGDSVAGRFAWCLTVTDIFTGWTENRAMWNKEGGSVYERISDIEKVLPFWK